MENKVNQLKLDTIDVDTIKYYIAFSFLSYDNLLKAKLFEYFDYDIKRTFLADKNDLIAFSNSSNITIPRSFLDRKNSLDIEQCYNQAFLSKDVKIMTYHDKNYPQLLKEIPDFPLSFYYMGNLDNINYNYSIAIVGSRRASNEALCSLNNIISGFKNSDMTIISGLAYGIDAQAHKSALDNNIRTIGVIGSGLDVYYPQKNKYLYLKILENNGAIISEYPLNTAPLPQNFPLRNRIVVGMSKGTLVGEAQLKSGAMISANLALDYNRELMCIPGNILNPNTEGIYKLIKNGAGIVSKSEDVLQLMNWDTITEKNKNENQNDELDDNQKKIWEELSLEAKNFDEIMNNINIDISSAMVALTEMELKGLIKQINNKYYKCK